MRFATATAIVFMLGVTPVLASTERDAAAPAPFDFAAADADGDGAISQAEWTDYITNRMQERRTAMFERRADQIIEAGDSDGDGVLSREELITALEARHDAFRSQRAERAEARAESRAERRAGRGDGDTRAE